MKASLVIHATAILGLGSILLCYGLALCRGHVKLWPVPMISDCGVLPPEKYPFRLGIVTSALLMALCSVVIYVAGVPRSKPAVVLGVAACLSLSITGTINEKEASKIHSISAIIFFALYWVNMVLLTSFSSRILFPCLRNSRDPVLGAYNVIVLVSRQALTIAAGIILVLAIIVSILLILLSLISMTDSFLISAFR